jgi:mannosyltransferase
MLALSNIFTGSSSGGPQQREVSDVFYGCGLTAILVVACATRFYGISQLPLWMDEIYTYFVATRPLHDIVFNELDNHPPLYYALQHFWLLSFPDIATFRFPAAAIGSVTAIVVALATSDLVNRRAGLAAGALLALSTGHIYFSQDARMYTLLTLGLSLSTWGLIGALQSDKRRSFYWIAYVIGGAIAIYSQIVALIYLPILNAIAFIWGHGESTTFYQRISCY